MGWMVPWLAARATAPASTSLAGLVSTLGWLEGGGGAAGRALPALLLKTPSAMVVEAKCWVPRRRRVMVASGLISKVAGAPCQVRAPAVLLLEPLVGVMVCVCVGVMDCAVNGGLLAPLSSVWGGTALCCVGFAAATVCALSPCSVAFRR